MPFEILKERVGTILVLRIEGQLLMGPKLRVANKHMQSLQDATGVLVDLEPCTRVDSAGLGELLMWYSMASREGRRFLLSGAKESIRQMIQLARVDGILLLARDREAGLAELGRA